MPWCLAGTVATYAFTRNVTRAISILMVDFSCALKLSMPLAVLSAMRECGEYHITVKGGKYLEALAKADTIVFDKTGTLTRATPQVVQVVPFSGCGEQEVSAAGRLSGRAFPPFHGKRRRPCCQGAGNFPRRDALRGGVHRGPWHCQPGRGQAGGHRQRITLFSRTRAAPSRQGNRQKFDGLDPQYSHLYLAASGVLVGVICIADPLRPEAAQVLRQLQKLGITQHRHDDRRQ